MFPILTTILCLSLINVLYGIIINIKITKLNVSTPHEILTTTTTTMAPVISTSLATSTFTSTFSKTNHNQFEFGDYQYDSRYDRFVHLARKRFLNPQQEFEELCLYLDRSLTLHGAQFRQYQHVFDMQKISYQQKQQTGNPRLQSETIDQSLIANLSIAAKDVDMKVLNVDCIKLMKQIEQLIVSVNVYQYLRPYLKPIEKEFLSLKEHDAVALYQEVKDFHEQYF